MINVSIVFGHRENILRNIVLISTVCGWFLFLSAVWPLPFVCIVATTCSCLFSRWMPFWLELECHINFLMTDDIDKLSMFMLCFYVYVMGLCVPHNLLSSAILFYWVFALRTLNQCITEILTNQHLFQAYLL